MPPAESPHPSSVSAHFREQAGYCRHLGSAFTAALCEVMAHDLEAGGPVASLVGDWTGNPLKDALALRLCGALHYAVLTNASPELKGIYPKFESDWDMGKVWPHARSYLSENEGAVQTFIQSPPQTNETRRSIALLPGFLKIAAQFDKPLNLLELGASAGLNQNWDQFNYQTASWSRSGNSSVMVDTDWHGPAPDHLHIEINVAKRAACDQNPLNIQDADAATRLRAYTWPDQPKRLARFDAAVDLARRMKTQVEKADAAEWLKKQLAQRPEGMTTVVYHSVFLQYPPADVIGEIMTSIETAGINTSDNAPLAWLCFEPEGLFTGSRASPRMITRLQTWPGGDASIFGYSDGHATVFNANEQ
ncbi:MAG: DUF2332 domain-containing protein [Pseudomonadota bacterium]